MRERMLKAESSWRACVGLALCMNLALAALAPTQATAQGNRSPAAADHQAMVQEFTDHYLAEEAKIRRPYLEHGPHATIQEKNSTTRSGLIWGCFQT